MRVPDPEFVRRASLADLSELGFPAPPPNFPLVWDAADDVEVRSRLELEARCCVLHVLLTAGLGAPTEATLGWLQRNGLTDTLAADEHAFLTHGRGNSDEYMLTIEAEWALAWLLGVADELDPTQYAGSGLTSWMPDLRADEPFETWRLRSPVQMRAADEAAGLLDLYYCLDWGHAAAIRAQTTPPGVTQPYVVGQRRWALEWAVVFRGEHHGTPPRWDEVELGV